MNFCELIPKFKYFYKILILGVKIENKENKNSGKNMARIWQIKKK